MSLLQNDVIPGVIPYTFRIGVIGHRALKDSTAVKLAVERTIKSIELMMKQVIINPYQYNNTAQSTWRKAESLLICFSKLLLASIGILKKETPAEQRTELKWHIISSVAKGTDQIVAKSAMEILGASLDAILPFRTEDYKQDFDQYEDLKTFNLLYEKADSKMNHKFELDPAPAKRSEGYRKAGEMIVQSSEIILAVWDGMPARGEGGTAEMAEYALSLKRPVIWVNANDPSSPVCLISAITKPEGEGIKIKTKPFPGRAGELSQLFVDLVEYNRDHAFSESGFSGISRPENERVKALPFYQGPEEWVLMAAEHVQGLLTGIEDPENNFHQVRNFILKGLIRDQAGYYASTARKKARHTKREQRFIGLLLVITLLAAAFHLFDIGHSRSFENLIVTLVVVLPAIAASQHAIGSINDFERISSRSSRMEEILKRLEKSFKKATTYDELRIEIQNAEDILSTENHEWCVSLSFRRISLPV